jgi:hypothetical protein
MKEKDYIELFQSAIENSEIGLSDVVYIFDSTIQENMLMFIFKYQIDHNLAEKYGRTNEIVEDRIRKIIGNEYEVTLEQDGVFLNGTKYSVTICQNF